MDAARRAHPHTSRILLHYQKGEQPRTSSAMTRNQEHCDATQGEARKKNPRTKTTALTNKTNKTNKKEKEKEKQDGQEDENKRVEKQRAC